MNSESAMVTSTQLTWDTRVAQPPSCKRTWDPGSTQRVESVEDALSPTSITTLTSLNSIYRYRQTHPSHLQSFVHQEMFAVDTIVSGPSPFIPGELFTAASKRQSQLNHNSVTTLSVTHSMEFGSTITTGTLIWPTPVFSFSPRHRR